MGFVLDASIVMAWHFADEASDAADALLDRAYQTGFVVPSNWQSEIANGALMGERRRRAVPAQTARFLELLDGLRIDIDFLGADRAFDRVLPLARAHELTVYDALYLELAERRGLPLATLDKKLTEAARRIGVEVLT